LKSKAQIERKESKMSTRNEMKMSKLFGVTQLFLIFMALMKGVLMYERIVYIMKASLERFPASEN